MENVERAVILMFKGGLFWAVDKDFDPVTVPLPVAAVLLVPLSAATRYGGLVQWGLR